MTSVAAYDYRGNTVAFVGTRNGKLKKVGVIFAFSVYEFPPLSSFIFGVLVDLERCSYGTKLAFWCWCCLIVRLHSICEYGCV